MFRLQVCAVNDVTVLGRGANEDLEELLSSDPDEDVPLAIPFAVPVLAVPLPPAELVTTTGTHVEAGAVPEQGSGLAVTGTADMQNGSRVVGAAHAQGVDVLAKAADVEGSAPESSPDGVAAPASMAATFSEEELLSGGETDAAGLRLETFSRQSHSGGASATAKPAPAAFEPAGETAGRQPPTPITTAPAQTVSTPAAAVDRPSTAGPVALNGASLMQPPVASSAAMHDAALAAPVAPVPSSGAPGQPRLGAPPADAVPAKAAARAGLEFGELPVGSGRSGGGIYDVLVQARQQSKRLACANYYNSKLPISSMNHLSRCKVH